MHPLRIVDRYLNAITMYRLVVYGLGVIAALAVALAAAGSLPLPVLAMVVSLGLVITVSYASNYVLRTLWHVGTATESWLITALILFLILPPVTDVARGLGVVAAAIIAMASKYLLVYHRKHIWNPAAIAVVITGLLGIIHATWWVGSPVLLWCTLVVGLLIARKIRRLWLVTIFVVVSLGELLITGRLHHRAAGEIITTTFGSWPLIFMGTIMLTEPSTTPPRLKTQLLYGAVVGLIFASQTHLGRFIASTPEVALVIGNLVAYAVTPRYKTRLVLQAKQQLSARVYDFIFQPERPVGFLPGQYMEWTLPHPHVDDRGNRRTFTIASSPTEKAIHVGIKIHQPSSSFKKAMLAMQPGDSLIAGQVAGDFVLPRNVRQKVVFIAGGIGVTPFRSMVQYLLDTAQQRDIILLYFAASPDEFSYKEILQTAAKIGLKLVCLEAGQRPSREVIGREVPDYQQRTFYVSGSPAMVEGTRQTLRGMQVPRRHIKTDRFSGY